MRKQKQSNNDDLQPSRGLLGLFHKIVMIILWPFRKPYIAIPLLILMYLIPTFIGARPTEVHIWYWNKIKNIFAPVSEQIVNKSKELLPESNNFAIPGISDIKEKFSPQTNKDKIQDEYSQEQEVRRQIFEKARQAETPIRIDVMSQKNQPQAPKFEQPRSTQQPTPQVTDNNIETAEQPIILPEETPNLSTEEAQTINNTNTGNELGLIYLSSPQVINGEAYVVSANEIVVGGNDIFLFGIYVDPYSTEGIDGKEFLENFINGDPVKCIVEAYTKQGIATGMCYVRQVSINHTLVNNGISQNVSLETSVSNHKGTK